MRSLLSGSLLALIFLFCSAFVWSQHHEHCAPFHLRWDFDRGDISKGSCNFLQIFERDLGIIHFAAAELDRHADFVSLEQPAAGIVHLEAAVRFVRLRAQADFLDFDLGLRLFGFAFFLGAFINELAIVYHAADGGSGVWRYFDKIQLGVACNLESLAERHDTDVAAIWSNQTDLRDADALIYSKF